MGVWDPLHSASLSAWTPPGNHQSLQMAMFLLQACDVLLLVLDELFDESVVRLLLRADLLCQRDPADRADIGGSFSVVVGRVRAGAVGILCGARA